jgi:hypothetical protein
LGILGDCGGNRVSQLSCEPVHDVVHLLPLLRRLPRGPVALPDRKPAYTWTVDTDRARDVFDKSDDKKNTLQVC